MTMQKGARTKPDWETRLIKELPLLGHRNWIVVADAAYPVQSSAGIETAFARGEPVAVVRTVLARIAACGHLHANVFIDRELEFVSETDAPGIVRYRQQLDGLLRDTQPQSLPHEQIIARLDECARVFRVLILKTELSLPYTSVFLELGCGYWSAGAEERLRKTMRKPAGRRRSAG